MSISGGSGTLDYAQQVTKRATVLSSKWGAPSRARAARIKHISAILAGLQKSNHYIKELSFIINSVTTNKTIIIKQ